MANGREAYLVSTGNAQDRPVAVRRAFWVVAPDSMLQDPLDDPRLVVFDPSVEDPVDLVRAARSRWPRAVVVVCECGKAPLALTEAGADLVLAAGSNPSALDAQLLFLRSHSALSNGPTAEDAFKSLRHTLRNCLNAAMLQLSVARKLRGAGMPENDPLESVRQELRRAADVLADPLAPETPKPTGRS